MTAIKLNEKSFQKEVLEGKGIALVDFWAVWCGPCQIMGPIIDQLAQDYGDKVKVAKVNVDENQSLAAKYEVMSIPTLIIFKDGQLVDKLMGIQSKEALKEKIASLLKDDKK